MILRTDTKQNREQGTVTKAFIFLRFIINISANQRKHSAISSQLSAISNE
ncbi:MAG: hypothetical protein F6K17_12685 [Okeania sp. SIO3C4]|nr:hypothetical protein [Okeania sp. SIO3C4]